jgi:hypothetical protein
MSKLEVGCSDPEVHASFTFWLERHMTSLQNVSQCSLVDSAYTPWARTNGNRPILRLLPCPQLRQLHLKDPRVQLEPADGWPGVLHDCSDLTTLDLQGCDLGDTPAAAVAFAALAQLKSLRVEPDYYSMKPSHSLFAELELPLQLTHLSLDCASFPEGEPAKLSQLSSLVNLEHLCLDGPGPEEPEVSGLLSQLVKLTCLEVSFMDPCDAEQRLQHLSCLTALHQLSLCSDDLISGDLAGLSALNKLTSLELNSFNLEFSTTATRSWACLTALEKLAVVNCRLQPEALGVLAQLQALSLQVVHPPGGATPEQVLAALSGLLLLTEMQFAVTEPQMWEHPTEAAPGTAYTVLTASTNLRSLQVSNITSLAYGGYATGCVLFPPGKMYPQLLLVDMRYKLSYLNMDLSEGQLQQLCSCCPNLQGLVFMLECPSPTAFLPLLQLPALTHLEVNLRGGAASDAVGVVAQLTGLQELKLSLDNDAYHDLV